MALMDIDRRDRISLTLLVISLVAVGILLWLTSAKGEADDTGTVSAQEIVAGSIGSASVAGIVTSFFTNRVANRMGKGSTCPHHEKISADTDKVATLCKDISEIKADIRVILYALKIDDGPRRG